MYPTSRALPGFASPAVGFELPFEMLRACHERVQRTLALLGRLVTHVGCNGHDADSRSAAADVLRYFDQAAPHHHEDEERHVFPLLQAAADPLVRAAVQRLHDDHAQMATRWSQLRPVLLAWRDEAAPAPLDDRARDAAQAFAGLYDTHIRLEEDVVYPAAEALLDASARARMGTEMQARRRG